VDPQGEAYGGREELEILEAAHRYNDHIVDRFVSALRRAPTGSPVLDFGAGIGTLTRRFRERTGLVPSAVELDPSQRQELDAQGISARAEVLDYPEGHFGLVLSSNVLEHIEDDVGALREIHGRLRAGGIAAFWVPASPMLYSAFDRRVGHHRRYTRHALVAAFEAAGFEVLHVTHEDSLGFLVALVFKVVRRRNGKVGPRAIRMYDAAIFPASLVVDRVAARFFGKNLFLVARRTEQ